MNFSMQGLPTKWILIFTFLFLAWKVNEAKASIHLFGMHGIHYYKNLKADTLKPIKTSIQEPVDGIDDDIYFRDKQENDLTRDPTINKVPVQRLLSAKQVRDQYLFMPPVNGSSTSLNALSWTERGPNNVGGRTRALLFDLNDKANGYKKVFAGGVGGGIWYTTDITSSSISWNKINDFLDNIAISCIIQNPNNPSELYAGTGEGFGGGDAISGLGLYHSMDGGNSWTLLSSTSTFNYINSVLVDNSGNVYIAGNSFGIQKSTDQGITWTKVLGNPVQGLVSNGADIQIASNGDIYASLGLGYGGDHGQIFLSDFSTNGSNTGNKGTWVNITPNPSGKILTNDSSYCSRIKLAVAPGNPNLVYAMMEGYKSNNLTYFEEFNKKTYSWIVRTVPTGPAFTNNQAWYSMAMTVDPNQAGTLFIGSLDAEKSVDSGKTWVQASNWFTGSGSQGLPFVHADHHTYVYAPGSSDRILMGTDGGVFYCDNATNTAATALNFISKNNGFNVTQFYSVAVHPSQINYFLGGTQDNGTQQFSKSGLGSTLTALGGDGGNCIIDQSNSNIQIGTYTYNYFYLSQNGGNSWSGYQMNGNGGFINPLDYDSKSKNIYSGNLAGTYFLWRNITSGTSKPDTSTVSVKGFNNRSITFVTVSPTVPKRVYFGLNNGTFVMVDHADSVNKQVYKVFTPNPSYTNVSVSSISIDPANENHILISFSNYGIISIYETKNAGSNSPVWTGNEGNLPDIPVRYCMLYPGNSNMAIIATDLGVWSTTSLNGTSTQWLTTNSGLANTRVQMLKFRASDRTLAAATHGRGIFTTILPVFGTDTIKGNNSLCIGASTKLSSTSPSGVWSVDNSTIARVDSTGLVTGISAGTAIIYHNSSGVYSQKIITVYALPNAGIGGPSQTSIYQGDYLTLFASGGGNKYLWSTGDTTQFLNIYKAGNYNVRVTNPNGCSVISSNITVTVLPPLSANNLKLSISSVTCKGGQDGSLNIKALKSLAYSAVITGTNTNRTISFTDSLKINQLSAGTYSVCINLTNESGFNQCFTVVITEPQDLSVYTALDRSKSLLQLSLGGSNQYTVIWNGTKISTSLDTLSLPLKNGINSLQVSTDRICQGVINKQINFLAPIQPYPVPFQDKINLDFGNQKINTLDIEIYNISNGIQVLNQSFNNISGIIQLNTSYLPRGTYALKIKSESLDTIYKISKL